MPLHAKYDLFQVELLEKAKRKNIIVYLGTGSGKTFIAVMLIRHMRDLVTVGKKVVFLCNNVALLEQQAKVIASTTGLVTSSYCGAQGEFIVPCILLAVLTFRSQYQNLI